jgi:hypothetical protein
LAFFSFSAFALFACGPDRGGSTSGDGGSDPSTSSSTSTSSSSGQGGAGGGSSVGPGGGGAGPGAGGGGGGAPSGACQNKDDLAIVQDPNAMVKAKVEKCGKDNLGAEPKTLDCIKMQTMLSGPCAQCFDDTVHCVVDKCFQQCFSDPSSQACTDCRAMNCDPAFTMCSGLPPN